MRSVKASFVEEKLAGDLRQAEGDLGRILSVHARVLNLEWQDRLITVAESGIERACDEILLGQKENFTEWNLTCGEEVRIESSHIYGKCFLLDMSGADCFKLPEPQLFSKNTLHFPNKEFLAKIDTWIYRNGRPSALYHGYFGEEESSALGRYFKESFDELKENGMQMEEDALLACILKMCGAGIGLTPSADDCLAGLLLLFSLCYPDRREKYQSYAKAVFGKTVKIAAYIIKNAAEGRGRMSEIELLNAVLSGDFAKTEECLKRVQLFGSTSGTDTLVGIAFGLHYLEKRKEEKEYEEHIDYKKKYIL